MITPKDLARLADVPTLRIKKYMSGKALPTPEEYDKISIVLGLTELNRADYCYEYDTTQKRRK